MLDQHFYHMKKLTISCVLSLLVSNLLAQWTLIGPEGGFSDVGSAWSIVRVNPFDNQPYCAYITFHPNDIQYQVTVEKWDGTEWSYVGGQYATLPFTNDFAGVTPQSLEFEMNPVVNEPILAIYRNDNDPETTNPDEALVLRYTGSAEWESYGNWPILQTYGADVFQEVPSLAISPTSGFPAIAFTTATAPQQNAIQWTPEGWDLMEPAEFSENSSTFQSMTYNPITSEAYIFHGGGQNSYHEISRFDGLLWEQVGNDDFFPGTIGDAQRQNTIEISPITGDPYIAYLTNEGPSGVAVRTLVDGEWVLVGPEDQNPFDTPLPEGRLFDLEINPVTGEPYVLLYSAGGVIDTAGPTLWRFDGTEWIVVGDDSIEQGILPGLSIAFDTETGAPYVSMINGPSSAPKVRVYRWDGLITSTEEVTAENQIEVFPNPALSEVKIVSPKPGELLTYHLTDIAGKTVMSFKGGDSHELIDVSHLNSGVYVLTLIGEDLRLTSKIVVED